MPDEKKKGKNKSINKCRKFYRLQSSLKSRG